MAAPVFEKKFVQDIRQPVRVRRCGDLMFTGDAKADTIYVEVYNDGVPYNLTGTVTLNCIRVDGATVAVTGSISGNVAQATLAQACCAISGPLAVVMKITSGDVTSTILKAVYTVDVGVTGTTVDPGTIVNNVNTLIAAIETAVESIPADYSDLLAAIAPTYSNASTYAVGDYVWYDGNLYRCTTAISTAENWTAAHWESAVVSEVDATLTQQGEAADAKATGDEIAELKSAVNSQEKCDVNGIRIASHFANIDYDASTLATSANNKRISSDLVFVRKGDIVNIKAGSLRYSVHLYAGTVSSYTRISASQPDYTTEESNVKIYVDGFFYVTYADATSYSTAISVDDFDGSVSVTSYVMTKADKIAFENLNDGFSCTHLNVLEDSILVSTIDYWYKISGTNILTHVKSNGEATYNSWLVPVDGESVYTFKEQTRYVYPVAADGITALADSPSNITSIDTSQYSGCKYIAISVRNDNFDMSTYCVSKGDTAKKGNTYLYPNWFSERFDPVEDTIYALNQFVTPQMFGAVADGVTDDVVAFEDALDTGKPLYIPTGEYYLSRAIDNPAHVVINGDGKSSNIKLGGSFLANEISHSKMTGFRLYCSQYNEITAFPAIIGSTTMREVYCHYFDSIFNNVKQLTVIDHCDFRFIQNYFCASLVDSYVVHSYINAPRVTNPQTVAFTGTLATSVIAGNYIDFMYKVFNPTTDMKHLTITGNVIDFCYCVFYDRLSRTSFTGNTINHLKKPDDWDVSGNEEMDTTNWCVIKRTKSDSPLECSILSGNSFSFAANYDMYLDCTFYGTPTRDFIINDPVPPEKINYRAYKSGNTRDFENVMITPMLKRTVNDLPTATLSGICKTFNHDEVIYQGNLYININGEWKQLTNAN